MPAGGARPGAGLPKGTILQKTISTETEGESDSIKKKVQNIKKIEIHTLDDGLRFVNS